MVPFAVQNMFLLLFNVAPFVNLWLLLPLPVERDLKSICLTTVKEYTIYVFFFYYYFIISGLTFDSLIHFEFICVYGIRK